MSGFCGVYSPRNPELASGEILNAMLDAFRRPRPAVRETFVDQGVAVGRLEDRDGSPAQFSSTSPSQEGVEWTFCLSGRVFAPVSRGATSSNSEKRTYDHAVLASALTNGGERYFEKLDGAFLLAAWQKKERRLLLHGDPLGKRPLYYAWFESQRALIFASEAKALLAHPYCQREIDQEAFALLTSFGYVPAPYSIFKGVKKLFQGERLSATPESGLNLHRYWRLPDFQSEDRSPDDFALEVREKMAAACGKYSQGAEKVGVYFSAGFDSATVACAIKLQRPEPTPAFTLSLLNERGESPDLKMARRVEKTMGLNLQALLLPKSSSLIGRLTDVFQQVDEPVFSPHLGTQCVLGDSAFKSGARVCYSGGGGVNLYFTRPEERDEKRLLQEMAKYGGREGMLFSMYGRHFSPKEISRLCGDQVENPKEVAFKVFDQYLQSLHCENFFDYSNVLNGVMRTLGRNGAMYRHVEAMTGVNQVMAFFDLDLMALGQKIPYELKKRRSSTGNRLVLERAFYDLLPKQILERKKEGYPGYFWDREIDVLQERFLSRRAVERLGLFNFRTVRSMLDDKKYKKKRAANQKLLSVIFMQAWGEVFMLKDLSGIDWLTSKACEN